MKNIIISIISALIFLTGCSTIQQSLDKNITQPKLKKESKLIYPVSAQKNNIMGTASIMFTISNEGSVLQTRIYKSSGNKTLDLAAENYCKQLEFFPAT